MSTLQTIQGFHLDSSPVDVTLLDGVVEKGIGNGFSAFMGLSEKNSLWIASLNDENRIVDTKRIEFNAGDLVIVPFGTLHAGDMNRTGTHSMKVFTEVFSEVTLDSQSQLWVIQGEGFTRNKQRYQLNHVDPS